MPRFRLSSRQQEKFVPQMINLEVLGGVDFKKVLSRSGGRCAQSVSRKAQRRMNVAHADAATSASADVFHSGGAQPIGSVVMATASPQGGSELLFEAPLDRLASGSLHLQSADGPRLTVRPALSAVRSDGVSESTDVSDGLCVALPPDYPLILAANRDEFATRRTRPASWWGQAVSVLAGHDEEAGVPGSNYPPRALRGAHECTGSQRAQSARAVTGHTGALGAAVCRTNDCLARIERHSHECVQRFQSAAGRCGSRSRCRIVR